MRRLSLRIHNYEKSMVTSGSDVATCCHPVVGSSKEACGPS